VQIFGWRLIRRAIPSGARAGKYSRHISKLCSRCGTEETDVHLFFSCNFARAAWFSHPWCLKVDVLISNSASITAIISNMLTMNHPHATLENILTFLWCLWKSRNDNLFNRISGHPSHVHLMANAIKNNLEMIDFVQDTKDRNEALINQSRTHKPVANINVQQVDLLRQGSTIKTDRHITGTRLYSDAAWKTKKVSGLLAGTSTGIGVYCHIQEGSASSLLMIQASTQNTETVLQAEAEALLLAVMIAARLNFQCPTFLTDNSTLASAAAMALSNLKEVPWEIRWHLAQFSKLSDPQVFHISRELNGVAHNCAHQALRQSLSQPIYSCSCSSHRNQNCPIIFAVQQIKFTDVVLHAVNCL
jgi:hypothetical protein